MGRTRKVAALAVVGALALASCGSSESDAGGGSGSKTTTTGATSASQPPVALTGPVNDKGTEDVSAEGDAQLSLELGDNYFSPTYVEAAPGSTITVELENQGERPHTFTTADGKVDEQVEPGETAQVEVAIPADGSLAFACNFHGDMGMQGAFFTVAGSGSGSPQVTTTTGASSSDGY